MLTKLILIIVLLSPVAALAQQAQDLKDWTVPYGQNLDQVPYTIRNQFQLSSGRSWSNASFEDRLAFLDKLDAEKRDKIKSKHALEQKLEQDKINKVARDKAERQKDLSYEKKQKAKAKELENFKKAQKRKLEQIVRDRRRKMEQLKRQRKNRNN